MTRKHSTVPNSTLCWALVVLASAMAPAAPLEAQSLAISGVRVFDGDAMIERTTVVVDSGVIQAVDPAAEIPPGAEILDGSGMTLLPGLIDCHTHTWGDALERAAIFGVTTQLDMFTAPDFAAAQRRAQEAGEGDHRADLFSAGFLATAPGGHGTQYGIEVPTLTAPDQADAWVAARLAEGSDYIKIVLENGGVVGRPLPSLEAEVVAALVRAAHARETLAVAHATNYPQAETALAAGADGLVHLFREGIAAEEFVARAADRGLFVVPTLTVLESTTGVQSGASLVADRRFDSLLTGAEIANLSTSFPARASVTMDAAFESVRLLHAAGVPILAGSDAPNPGTTHGASMHRELELLVAAGLDPLAALAAATSQPARAFGLADRGRVAPGLRADLVLIQGDPREDITSTRAIEAVWKGGRAIARPIQQQAQAGAALPGGLVADFESGEASAAFGFGWASSTDSMMGGESTVTFEVVAGGAAGTSKALAIRGEIKPGFPFPWAGAMFFPGDAPMAAVNLSATAEVAFLAKGTPGTYRLMAFTESLGQMPGQQFFEVGREWKEVVIPVDGFAGADFGGLEGLLWTGGPAQGAFELVVDQIELRP